MYITHPRNLPLILASFIGGIARFTTTALGVVIMIFTISVLWYEIGPAAPGDTYKPVAPSSIGVGAVSGSACGLRGPVVQAWLTNDAGENLYGVRCADGTVTEVSR